MELLLLALVMIQRGFDTYHYLIALDSIVFCRGRILWRRTHMQAAVAGTAGKTEWRALEFFWSRHCRCLLPVQRCLCMCDSSNAGQWL